MIYTKKTGDIVTTALASFTLVSAVCGYYALAGVLLCLTFINDFYNEQRN